MEKEEIAISELEEKVEFRVYRSMLPLLAGCGYHLGFLVKWILIRILILKILIQTLVGLGIIC